MEKRIWGYARVSTREQAVNSAALEQQCQRLRDAGATRIFIDTESGRKDTRKQLTILLKEIKLGGCDEVICTRIDRLARSMVTLHKTLEQFQGADVSVRFLDQGLDVGTSHGKLLFNLLGSVAEWESDLLSDRVLHGKEYSRQQGKAFGSTPFGYTKNAEGKHVLNYQKYKETDYTCAEVARDMVETFLRVGTLRGALREMNAKYSRVDRLPGKNEDFPVSPHGLSNYLHNPVLRGHLVYKTKKNQQVFRDNHPALISEAEYAEICRISQLAKETRGYKAKRGRYAVSGLVFCSCGSRCKLCTYGDHQRSRQSKTKNKTYGGKPPRYPEFSYARCIRAVDQPQRCERRKSTPIADIEAEVIKALCNRANDITMKMAEPKKIIDTPEIAKLREQVEAIAHLDNPTIAAAKRELEGQIEALRLGLMAESSGQLDKIEKLKQIGANPKFWKNLPIETKRRFFQNLIDKVVIGDTIEVILSF